jgi:hypothetical protein
VDSLTYYEFLEWCEFLSIRPIGWREDKRAAMLMQAQGVKASEEQLFPSLSAVKSGNTREGGLNTLKGSSLFMKMMGAKGGDKINLD